MALSVCFVRPGCSFGSVVSLVASMVGKFLGSIPGTVICLCPVVPRHGIVLRALRVALMIHGLVLRVAFSLIMRPVASGPGLISGSVSPVPFSAANVIVTSYVTVMSTVVVMSAGSLAFVPPGGGSIPGRPSCCLFEVVALAVLKEELVLDLHSFFNDDVEGEVVDGPALEASR